MRFEYNAYRQDTTSRILPYWFHFMMIPIPKIIMKRSMTEECWSESNLGESGFGIPKVL